MRILLNSEPIAEDFGRLVLRLAAGGFMFWYHGLPKLLDFGSRMDSFSDPMGIGSTLSLGLITFAETVCALLVVAGLWCRAACIPLLIGMSVVVFIVQGDAAFNKKEDAVLYLCAYVVILLIGAGRFAVDRISFR